MYRPRRLRQSETMRALVRETNVSPKNLIMPLFVRPGKKLRVAIPAMPGQFQYSVDTLVEECRRLKELGVPAVLLFGLPATKDARGSAAYAAKGTIQQAVRAIKTSTPHLIVITDVCLCAYTSHGHCGVVKIAQGSRFKAQGKNKIKRLPSAFSLQPSATYIIDNDATVEVLAKIAISHANAGADLVAPSDMMDGTVGALRHALDTRAHHDVGIMAYSVKYASSFYGPFRQAVESTPQFGDRRSYQMDSANIEEAIREAQLDIEQGADIIMVKPALAYLDVIRRLKETFHHPLAAFNVSGEYAMVKAAAERGWLSEQPVWMETLIAMKRAGADLLITYWAKEAAVFLRKKTF